MGKVKNKLYDWKDRLRKGKMFTLVISLIVIILVLTVFSIKKSKDYRQLAENSYNEAFYELVEYANNTEKLLAKATISNSSAHSAKILTTIWRTATLAQTYLSRIPIETQDLENTQKFLNQVSDYCYSLSKKSFNGDKLSQEELDKLTELHKYSIEFENTINQLEVDLFSGDIRWGALKKNAGKEIEQGDKNISQTSFSGIEEDLHQYTGLIYDGAFSENQSEFKGLGLTGYDVDEQEAQEIARKFIGEDKVKEINKTGEPEEGNIQCFSYEGKIENDTTFSISVSKKGGHVVSMNCNREVTQTSISDEDAINNGKEFLNKREYNNMKETYFMKENNIITVNYAYMQNDAIIYPDLVKVKVALDNGEVLGLEATNYLNSHQENRNLPEVKITSEEAQELVNKNVEIKAVDLAVIPTEWKSELLCWEIKGTAEDNDFLVYINVENGREEDILMIIDTPNGTLTT